MKTTIQPTTAAVMIAAILAIAAIAIFGGEKATIAIVGAIGVVAAAFARSLVAKTIAGDTSAPDDAVITARKPPSGTGGGGNNLLVFVLVACGALFGISVEACSSALTPAQQKDVREGITVVDAGCKLIGAVTNDGASNAICATATEIGDIVSAVTAMQASAPDAGASHRAATARCTPIPGTAVCATPLELSLAIDGVKAKRAAGAARDGGAL